MSIDQIPSRTTFRISPLVSGSLIGLFIVLLAPLPLITWQQHQDQFLPLSAIAAIVGGVLLFGLLSQRVEVDAQGVQVDYASWVPNWLGYRWHLAWQDIASLKSRPTSQGGQAHYFVTHTEQAYLLPMRIVGFAQFLQLVEAYTHLKTSHIKPLAQPWMYLMLGLCVVLMGLIDLPIIVSALKPLQ